MTILRWIQKVAQTGFYLIAAQNVAWFLIYKSKTYDLKRNRKINLIRFHMVSNTRTFGIDFICGKSIFCLYHFVIQTLYRLRKNREIKI